MKKLFAFAWRNYYLTTLILYALSILLAKSTGFALPQQLLAIILCLVLPGYILWKLFCHNLPIASPHNQFLSIPFSLGILSAGLLLLSKIVYHYTEYNTIALIFLISLLMICVQALFGSQSQPKNQKFEIKNLWPVIIALLLLVVLWLTYKFFPGDDTYTLADSIRQSIITGNVTQAAIERRPLFTPLLILFYYSGHFSIFFLLKYFVPLLSFLSFIPAIGLLVKKLPRSLFRESLSLLFLASPFIIFSLSYTIPQSILIVFLLPILILSTIGLQKNRIDLLAIGFFLSFLSTGYHELSFIPLTISLVAILIYLFRLGKKIGWQLGKYIFIVLIIILPYTIIFQILSKVTSFFSVLTYATGGEANRFAPRLWYVNYYKNPDGIIFSYQGLSGLVWYAYLGAAAFFVLIILLVLILRARRQRQIAIDWISYLPLILFTLIFFFVAEVYPRLFSIAFLPERAWVFMLIGFWLLVIFLTLDVDYFDIQPRNRIFLDFIIILAIFSGIAASIYLNMNRSIMMSNGDQPSVSFIQKSTPENAIIVSTQVHEAGPISIAGRSFINVPSTVDSSNFATFQQNTLTKYNQSLGQYQAEKDEIIYGLFGEQLSVKKTPLLNNKAAVLNAPVYFVYSAERFANTKFVGNPNYFAQNDLTHKDLFFSSSYLPHAIYHDNNVVIFRLK